MGTKSSCVFSGKLVPKDKVIVRYIVRNIIESSALRDVQEACAFEFYTLPKLYFKNTYSIEAAIHNRIVRVRSRSDRRIRSSDKVEDAAEACGHGMLCRVSRLL